ncbi:TonB-linked SusC/RagA family outer membrane protein [Pontibacter mucosus]|uniref:TonB-linked SusC/RagA family outer membrane protein n=1 Tax=Pontibacter mucosus TaxID=1649266 RepID=A0A2T5YHT7_9BACT|nr:TonB-dependent receptor [Pontibacter mucosus]PTX18887.1 TonB-linked SusC/RagA family outer membrane protein [Pontibacter mucosus]
MMRLILTGKRWQYCWLLFLFMAVLPPVAFGQGQAVKGKVRDSKGVPLPGVTVVVKGTDRGTSTNIDGQFSLPQAKQGDVLVFSYIGFANKEVTVTGAAELDVVMAEADNKLNEVVVVGYGTQKKVNLTGSVAVVEGKELTKRQVGSTSLALQGTAPGVSVRQQSGVPGGDGGGISIRGVGSINAGSNPLILVDNVEMSLDAVDPNSIESISVLKDAAASAIYGSRAANGVILITTKRGSEGVKVNLSSYVAVQQPTDLPEKVNALDHMKLWDVAQVNSGLPPAFTKQIEEYERLGPDNFARFNTDWKDLVLTNNGLMHNHNINVSAGTEKIKVFASGGYLDQNGITANTGFKRSDLRFNTDVSLSKRLTASMDLVLNNSERTWPGNSSPTAIIRYMLGMPATAPGRFNTGEWGEGWSNSNPAAQAEDGGFDKYITNSRIISGTLTYRPIDDLELLANYSSNRATSRNRRLQGQYDIYVPDLANNKLDFARPWPNFNAIFDNFDESQRDLVRFQGTYAKALGKHNVKLLTGFSAESFSASNIDAFRQNLISEDFPYLSAGDATGQSLAGGEYEFSMASVYSRINYDYDEKYLLELNGRFDASSRFIKENWWELFPSVSAGWRISNESFWGNLANVVNEAKLRVSYGALGNQNVGSYYPTYTSYAKGTPYDYYFNNVVNSGYALTTAANPFIQWERSIILDAGLDLAFFNNRLSVTADYFKRDIDNMLQLDLIPSYVGLNAPYVNIGKMTNKGWELSLGWKDAVGDFTYQVTGNVSDVKNEVVDLGGREYISGSRITKEGYAYNSYYGYIAEGLFQSEDEIASAPFHFANTKPGDIRYRDINNDKKIDANDRAVLGNYFPRYEYSLNLSAQFKGFDVTAFFQGVGKMDNYLSGTGTQPFYSASFQGSIYEHQKDYWTPENRDAAYPRLTANSITNNYVTSSFWMRESSFLRLKNVVLGYTIPKSLTDKIKVGSARFYVSGQNLFTWSNYFPGFDPEQRDTGGEFYPIMTTYTTGFNLSF